MDDHFAAVKSYFTLSEALETSPAAYTQVFHPEVEQIEYPNLLTKTTQRRSLEGILDNVRAGRELLQNPKFEDMHMQMGANGSIIVETHWHATVMDNFGLMVQGNRIAAQFCMIFEFKDNLIITHRTYRCYEPFSE